VEYLINSIQASEVPVWCDHFLRTAAVSLVKTTKNQDFLFSSLTGAATPE